MKSSEAISARIAQAHDRQTYRERYVYAAMSKNDHALKPAVRVLLCAIIARCFTFDDGIASRDRPLPFDWLARTLGIRVDGVSEYVRRLVNAGYVRATLTDGRGYIFEVILSKLESGLTLLDPSGPPGKIPGVTPGKNPGAKEDAFSIFVEEEKTGASAPATGHGPAAAAAAAASDLASGIKKDVIGKKEYRADPKKAKKPTGPEEPDESAPLGPLARVYKALRESSGDASDGLKPWEIKAVAVCEAKLLVSGVTVEQFDPYLRGLFEWWQRDPARGAWPSPKILASDQAIGAFLSKAATGRLNGEWDKRWLREHLRADGLRGFDLPTVAELVDLLNSGSAPVWDDEYRLFVLGSTGYAPEDMAAARWVIEHASEIPLVSPEVNR